jgi:cytochrome c553
MSLRRRAAATARAGAIIAVAIIAGGGLFAWSGLYNVAASRGHFEVVERFLAFVMRRSVETHSLGVAAQPALDDPDLVTLGAAHFHSGCASCHGAPGYPASPVYAAMLPPPSDLVAAAPGWDDEELFWIVQNGIKYTGMPAWPANARDDEVWALVAFLRALSSLDAAAYGELAIGDAIPALPPTGEDVATGAGLTAAAIGEACARCHGSEGTRPRSALVPVLHGQSATYLLAALEAYADGTRRSGIMNHAVAGLSPPALSRLAAYYAGLAHPATDGLADGERDASAEGRRLAEDGAPERDIPPCLSCHGAERLPAYPSLNGQSRAYIAGQLRLYREGLHRATAGGEIMAAASQQLLDADIAAAAEYFAAAPPLAGADAAE